MMLDPNLVIPDGPKGRSGTQGLQPLTPGSRLSALRAAAGMTVFWRGGGWRP